MEANKITIAVGGCSFSDYRYDIHPYGRQVADHFDCNYIITAWIGFRQIDKQSI